MFFRFSLLSTASLCAALAFFPVDARAQVASTVITQDTVFSPGEYVFDTLVVASSSTLTLKGDPTSDAPFKGVVIRARSLVVEAGSRISAIGTGYADGQGPGTSPLSYVGASYGGGGSLNPAISAPTYGSALEPTELGSGGKHSGGGAIRLLVSGTFTNDGVITANGNLTASGGSILVNAGTLAGSGAFTAVGGDGTYYGGPGGGGRIMIRYASSSFTGTVDASGGCAGPRGGPSCVGDGTAGLLDTTTNTLLITKAWRFQTNDSPLSFAHIIVSGGVVTSDPGVSISTDRLTLSAQGVVSFGDDVRLRATNVNLDGVSRLSFSGSKNVAIDTLTVSGGSRVTTVPGRALDLTLSTLTIASDSHVDATAKGYPAMEGPGAPWSLYEGVGASYGGKGHFNTATSTYGDANNPTDFGSGGDGNGGGAIQLLVSGTFTNDGVVSANGATSASGGSVLVHTHSLTGSGTFSANGGGISATSRLGPGGGGRIALYSDDSSSFSGLVEAKGARNTIAGSIIYGYDGTVVIGSNAPQASNVLFLPGIEGSRLYEGTGCGKSAEEKLWEPVDDSIWGNVLGVLRGAGDRKIGDLALNQSGASVCSDIYTKEGSVIGSVGGMNIYASLISDMNALKSDGTIADWKPVAYDWRLSLDTLLNNGAERGGKIYYEEATSTPYIEQTLRALAARSKTGKVTIIAHSNGGLVAKALLAKLGDSEAAKLVDKLVMVGVPQSGAPADIGSLLVGYDAGIYKYGLPIVSNAAARAFVQNSPMAYHLLPSANYLASIIQEPMHPVVHFAGEGFAKERAAYGNSIVDVATLDDFLLAKNGEREKPSANNLMEAEILNPALISYANGVHGALDAWVPPAGIEVDQIAGWGVDTVGGVDFYTQAKTDAVTALRPVRAYRPIIIEDGDGVVPTPSALMMASSTNVKRYWVDLDKLNREQSSDREHKDLLEILALEDFIKNIITNGTSSLPAYISATQPAPLTENKKLTFFLHSPLTLQLTDSLGNVTGLAEDDTVTQDIPGSVYGEFGEVKYVTVPEGSAYQLTMNGQASGTFSLDTQETAGGVVTASSTIAGVQTTASTTVTMSILSGVSTLSPMNVDKNGDGTTDVVITPKLNDTVVLDTIPPEIQITFSTTTRSFAFTSTDNSGTTTMATSTVYPPEKKKKCKEKELTGIATTTVTARDEAGNVTALVYTERIPAPEKRSTITLKALAYNGATTTLSSTSLLYKWEDTRKGGYQIAVSDISTQSSSLESSYRANKKDTVIMTRTQGVYASGSGDKHGARTLRQVVPGMVIPYMKTKEGTLIIGY